MTAVPLMPMLPASAGGPGGQSVPRSADPTRELVVGGPMPAFTGASGLLTAQVYDDVVARYGSRVYELMTVDDACDAALFLLKAGAIGEGVKLRPSVTAPEATEVTDPELLRRIAQAKEVYDSCERVMKSVGTMVNVTLWELCDALPLGCNLAEQVFTRAETGDDAGRLIPTRFVCRPRWAWAFLVSPTMNLLGIRAFTEDGWRDIEPEHFTVFSWHAKNGDPRGRSILRPAYPWWNLKYQVLPDYGEYLKKFASKSVIITAGENQQPKEIRKPGGGTMSVSPADQNLEAGLKFQNCSVLSLPHGAEAHLLGSEGGGEAFDKGFDRSDRVIFRSIILATRALQEAKHGSKADTETNLDQVFNLAVESVRGPLSEAFRRQFLREYVRLNWGDRVAEEYTPFVHFGLSQHLASDLLTAFGNAWRYGVFVSSQRPWIWSKLGAPTPEGWKPNENGPGDYADPPEPSGPAPDGQDKDTEDTGEPTDKPDDGAGGGPDGEDG